MKDDTKIMYMLEQIIEKLDEQGRKLDEHGKKLDEHSKKLDEHSQKLDEHSKILSEHGEILSALRFGQDHLKAEIDGIKVSNAKEFGALKEQVSEINAKTEVLRDESWKNKTDIHRIKTTIGMK
jgi:DNA repair ATPase RecN